jgi:Xaa-Pro aminopeptidase
VKEAEETPTDGSDAESRKRAAHDQLPPAALLEFMTKGWEASAPAKTAPISGVDKYHERRQELSRRFPGMLIVVPAGVEKVRANDTTYLFRPSTDYLYLVGEGEPDEVLVMKPTR